MYAVILWGLLKPCKVRDYVGGFLVSFGFFYGMTVVVVPAFVFAEDQEYLLLWQSPQHHIFLAIIGIYMTMSGSIKLTQKNLLRGIVTYFIIFVGFLIFNSWINPALPDGAYINGFYSGPYKIFEIPILSGLITIKNYTVYLPIMLISNIAGGFIAFSVLTECRRLAKYIKAKRQGAKAVNEI
jgi:hypothetical protein